MPQPPKVRVKTILCAPAAILLLAAYAVAQVQEAGPCPNISSVTEFNMGKFMGKWYEQAHTRRWGSTDETDCGCHIFDKMSDMKFSYKAAARSLQTGTVFRKNGSVVLNQRGKDVVLNVTENGQQTSVIVVDTDYDNYAVLWSCIPIGNAHYESALVLTRQRNPPLASLLTALDALAANNVTLALLVYTEQRGCPNLLPSDTGSTPSSSRAPATWYTGNYSVSTTSLPKTNTPPLKNVTGNMNITSTTKAPSGGGGGIIDPQMSSTSSSPGDTKPTTPSPGSSMPDGVTASTPISETSTNSSTPAPTLESASTQQPDGAMSSSPDGMITTSKSTSDTTSDNTSKSPGSEQTTSTPTSETSVETSSNPNMPSSSSSPVSEIFTAVTDPSVEGAQSSSPDITGSSPISIGSSPNDASSSSGTGSTLSSLGSTLPDGASSTSPSSSPAVSETFTAVTAPSVEGAQSSSTDSTSSGTDSTPSSTGSSPSSSGSGTSVTGASTTATPITIPSTPLITGVIPSSTQTTVAPVKAGAATASAALQILLCGFMLSLTFNSISY